MNQSGFFLVVEAPEATLFRGEVEAVSSVNKEGPFDVLATHANFISLIEKQLIIRESNKEPHAIPFDHAVMHVRGGKIEVFVGFDNSKKQQK